MDTRSPCRVIDCLAFSHRRRPLAAVVHRVFTRPTLRCRPRSLASLGATAFSHKSCSHRRAPRRQTPLVQLCEHRASAAFFSARDQLAYPIAAGSSVRHPLISRRRLHPVGVYTSDLHSCLSSSHKRTPIIIMFNAWRTRRRLSKAALAEEPQEDETPVVEASPPQPVPTIPSVSTNQEPQDSVWATEDIDIGITRVVHPRKDLHNQGTHVNVVLYEVSLRFPQAGRLWRVQRSFADFAALHTAIETAFATELFDRNIHLPRPSRMSWGDFMSHGSAGHGSPDDPATQQMLLQLNAYLLKLVEIDALMAHEEFRDFLTPRPTSSGDTEERGKTLPTLAITPITSVVSELYTMKSVASPTTQNGADHCAPPVESQCTQPIYFGSGIQLRALGGLRVGLTKRGGLSGGQKVVAVAAGVAGMAFTGPLSAALALGALGGGVGKYQMNKNLYLTVNKAKNTGKSGFLHSMAAASAAQDKNANGYFVIQNAELVSGPRRALKFGDLLHLFCRNARKSVTMGQPPDSKRGHLMVANTESKRATLRLVSPYGYHGTVVCGSQVYIQILNGQWAGQYMSLQGDFLATGNSPTVFKVCQQDHACLASEEIIPITRPLAHRTPFKLRVMVYNVWLFPSILTSINDKLCPSTMPRAQAIPQCIAPLDVDVVVFCEAFCANAREVLVKGMKEHGFLYETKVVGEGASVSNKKAIDGGCFAMSRYPIEHFEELTFGAVAVGDDRMADKGVIYFQLRARQGETVHVFGTHLQAWETQAAVTTRKQQLCTLQDFIASKKISPNDAVLVAGDLNVDRCGQDVQEYEAMLHQLNVVDPELRPSSSQFSFDPLTNKLAVAGPSSGGRTERLDYVLASRSHRLPSQSTAEVVQLKATKEWALPRGEHSEELVDLSDHYPVVCELHFE